MDAKHSDAMFKLLEKQGEVLMESYRAFSHELHGLHVEEEMLMHKLYELMSAEGLLKKKSKRENDHEQQGRAEDTNANTSSQ